MNVPNHECKPFRNMTPEGRAAIVEALIAGELEVNHGDGWRGNVATIHALYIYRTRPRQLVIPWGHIKEEYKWAAMDRYGDVYLYKEKPRLISDCFAGEWCYTTMLNINTTGIDWRESLTARPEGV